MRWDPLGADQDPDRDLDEARSATPTPLSEALAGLTRRRDWGTRLDEARVHEVWQAAAGADLARSVKPLRLHGGVLVLEAASAAWATQVRYLSGELARRVNEELGAELVRQVRVVAGGGGSGRS